MKKHALILSALMLSPLAAETKNVESIFESLSSPARETINAPVQELFRARASIPAGDYELTADVRNLPAFMESLGLPAYAFSLESISLACSKGSITQALDLMLMLRNLTEIQMIESYESMIMKYKAGLPPVENDMLEIDTRTNMKRRALLLSQIESLPSLHLKPTYLSLRFSQAEAEVLITLLSAETPSTTKRIEADGTVGFEIISTDLDENHKKILESKLTKTPTVFFHLVDEHEFVIVIGSGTEALEVLKNSKAKMSSPSITVPSGLVAQLHLDQDTAQTLCTKLTDGFLKAMITNATDEPDETQPVAVETLIGNLLKALPQLTKDVDAQLWSQDGDIHGKLSTATSNYQLKSAPLLASEAALEPDTELYAEFSPLSNVDISTGVNATLYNMLYTTLQFNKTNDEESELKLTPNSIQKVTELVHQLTPSLTGGGGLIGKTSESDDDIYSEFKEKDGTFFAGIANKSKLDADFKTLISYWVDNVMLKEEQKEELLKGIEELSQPSSGDEDIIFRSSEKVITLGDDTDMMESVIASAEASTAPVISGGRFMLRGEMLENQLSRQLRERADALYIRLDSEGEKKDVYFQLDFSK